MRGNNRGFAVTAIATYVTSTFTLRPSIQSVSPKTGSLMGGQILTIKGDGFISDGKRTAVNIGGALCKIISISHSEIQCQTLAKSASAVLPVVVEVNGFKSICKSAVGCWFVYSTTYTPKVDSVNPSVIDGNHSIINIYGSVLPNNRWDLDVMIGDTVCRVVSSSQYLASCRVGAVVAGKYNLKVHVAGKGFARFEAGATAIIDCPATVSSITPIEGSIMGGTEVTINGSGFDPKPGQTVVKIGANNCTIIQVTYSKVICRTLAHATGSFEVLCLDY